MRNLAFALVVLVLTVGFTNGAHAQADMEAVKEFFGTAGVPGDRWTEGETMYPHVAPASHFYATMLYYPGTEELQPDEVRVTFMGSTYYPNQTQSGMSIFVELGNGDNFVFDMGIGSLRNYNTFSIPFASIDHVFITHLHMDHISDLAYFMMFRPIQGGYTPLHIYGPSGSEPKYGTAHMVEHMMEMTAWHQDSFHAWPIGEGYDPVVHEFDYMDEGGVAYEKKRRQDYSLADVTLQGRCDQLPPGLERPQYPHHGRQSPQQPDHQVRKRRGHVDQRGTDGDDVDYVTGAGYAARDGCLHNRYIAYTSVRIGLHRQGSAAPKYASRRTTATTRCSTMRRSPKVRHHWKGAFAFGAPDLVVFNIHGDGKVWWREGVSAGSSQTPRPVFKTDTITFPAPRHQVYDVINATIKANEIDPKLWYPKGHMPVLVREWPITEDITIPNPFVSPSAKDEK